jgi:hypothetical protein
MNLPVATKKAHDETYFAMLAYAMNRGDRSLFFDTCFAGQFKADLITTNALTGAVLRNAVVVVWKPVTTGSAIRYGMPEVHDARVWCTEETQKTDIVTNYDAHIRALATKVMRKLINK